MRFLVTGAAGFIGYHLSERLCLEGLNVVGIDNINDYYDVDLKETRLERLKRHKNFRFQKLDLCDSSKLSELFQREKFDYVINLAAQPGVRFSITHPDITVKNNITSFFNLLECCKNYPVKLLIYASSSSVYGNKDKTPFSIHDNVDQPVSLYAATKKSNELMAYTYHHLYKIPITGLRFFTVYGPWGRPDMAYYKFALNIMNDKPIEVYNNGDMKRDFTFISDVIESIYRLLMANPDNNYKLFNIGGEQPVNLLYFIETLEKKLGKTSIKIFKDMQPGDVKITCADSSELAKFIDYKPITNIEDGLKKFVMWFKEYYKF